MFVDGTARADRLSGGAERDRLVGNDGNDALFGLDADDLLIGDRDASDLERPGGNDRLFGGAGFDVLIGGRGNDRLDGGEGDDWLAGGYADGDFSEEEWASHSLGYGWAVTAGNDVYDGGTGNDTAFLLYLGESAAITLDMSSPRRAAAILRDGAAAGSIVNVETLTFQGGDGDDHVVAVRRGTPFVMDMLEGGAGDDVLDGGGGIDLLNGGSGDDTLIGGGEDIASYEDGFDGDKLGVHVDLRLNGVAQDTGGAGTDTLIGIRSLHGSSGADLLTGNGSGNELRDRIGGDDLLSGGNGGDDLRVERFLGNRTTSITLDGGAGDDKVEFWSNRNAAHAATLIGGSGNDTIAAHGAATARIDAGAGDDRVTVETAAGEYAVALGRGADTLILTEAPGAMLLAHRITVSDFATGAGGDRIDLSGWLGSAAIGYAPGNDPFGDYLRLAWDDNGVVLLGDRDGAGDAYDFDPLVVFEDARLGRFIDANFILPTLPTQAALTSDFF